MARIDDCRRVTLTLALFFLFLSLIGTELPWVKMMQKESYRKEIQMLNDTTYNTSCVGKKLYSTTFKTAVYMNLVSAQVCQTYLSGELPPYIGGANMKDVVMCSDLSFDKVSNFMINVNVWDDYTKACQSNGALAFVFIIFALLSIIISITINTFPKMVNKCCEDPLAKKSKIIRLVIGFLSIFFSIIALIAYSTGCISSTKANDVIKTLINFIKKKKQKIIIIIIITNKNKNIKKKKQFRI